MTIEISARAEAYRLAGKMRFYSWWGVDFHDKSVLIWKLNEVEREGFNYTTKIKTKLKNRLDLNIFELNDESVFNYVAQINEFAPKYIRSYKSGLYELARLMEKHGLRFKKSNLKVAIVTSLKSYWKKNEPLLVESLIVRLPMSTVLPKEGFTQVNVNMDRCI